MWTSDCLSIDKTIHVHNIFICIHESNRQREGRMPDEGREE